MDESTGIFSFRLNVLASNFYSNIVSILPDIIRSAIAPPKFKNFNRLPDHFIRENIASFLNHADKCNLACSDINNLHLIKPVSDIEYFFSCVARGEQDKAKQLLMVSKTKDKSDYPNFLLAVKPFTDYSGRRFNCTAYEYAYWAKDTRMIRMLEAQMDEPTKAAMLERIDIIERKGLTYTHHGTIFEGSKHFDITPLKVAYEAYFPRYTAWRQAGSPTEGKVTIEAAWMNVGKAQRDLPVHYVNEFFRHQLSAEPSLEFNEKELPRNLKFHNWITQSSAYLFPLILTGSSGLGVNFALTKRRRLMRGGDLWCAVGVNGSYEAGYPDDLTVFCRLDDVRTNELLELRRSLEPMVSSHRVSF